MDLRHGDCLEVMSELEDNSVDLMFADLPYGQTSCKWDSLIDLEQFWKQVNRVCKPDAPMVFTCTVKFGNSLINSNPKNFRYDLIWVKSAPCGFLNAKKMPMKKHEMIYVFYNKLPSVYKENIALHHKHKFLKEEKDKYMESDLYGNGGKDTQNKSVRKHKILYKKSEYEPPLPNSVIKETNHENAYNTEKRKKPIVRSKPNQYEPPLPNSVIKEDTGVYNECDHSSSKKLVRDTKTYKNESVLYGEIDRPNFIMRKNSESIYEPSLPNSILEVKSEKGKHATQKPVALMEWILKYYSREGGVVLDPTMGSGSMGVACEKQNRLFIGVEKDETIYNVALERCGL
jgi:DNA modification methylase